MIRMVRNVTGILLFNSVFILTTKTYRGNSYRNRPS